MKIRQVGAEFFHADRRTDRRTGGQTYMKKVIVAFRNLANAHIKIPLDYTLQNFLISKTNTKCFVVVINLMR
jgi:hypothetical protein